jgi:hypothetical protein
MRQPSQCTCGGKPKVLSHNSVSGGGRYRAPNVTELWHVECDSDECDYETDYCYTEESAINEWNSDVTARRARIAAPDKMIHDLKHKWSKKVPDIVFEALARILEELDEIKEKIDENSNHD